MSYTDLATEIVEGTGDYSVDADVMDYISEKIFDADTQIEVIADICEQYNITSAEDFESEFLTQLEEHAGPMLEMIGV